MVMNSHHFRRCQQPCPGVRTSGIDQIMLTDGLMTTWEFISKCEVALTQLGSYIVLHESKLSVRTSS